MWVAGRSDIAAVFCFLKRKQCNNTRVILKERDMREVQRTSDINPTGQNIVTGPDNARLTLKEGASAEFLPEESTIEEQEEARQKLPSSSRRWTEKLGKSLPNWPTVMPGPGHF